jgi:hypothetical protein
MTSKECEYNCVKSVPVLILDKDDIAEKYGQLLADDITDEQMTEMAIEIANEVQDAFENARYHAIEKRFIF